ncbi:hypothetical protein Tco_0927659 [Tanacetum coccineum]
MKSQTQIQSSAAVKFRGVTGGFVSVNGLGGDFMIVMADPTTYARFKRTRIKQFNAQEALDYGHTDNFVRPSVIKAYTSMKEAGARCVATLLYEMKHRGKTDTSAAARQCIQEQLRHGYAICRGGLSEEGHVTEDEEDAKSSRPKFPWK